MGAHTATAVTRAMTLPGNPDVGHCTTIARGLIDVPIRVSAFLWCVIKSTWKQQAGLGILRLVDAIGIYLAVTSAASVPIVVLLLSTNPLALCACVDELAWPMFFMLSIARLCLADPMHYCIGQRGIQLITMTARRHRKLRRIGKLQAWASRTRHAVLLPIVVLFTVLPIPGVSIYWIAGAAKLSPWKTALADVVGTLVYVTLIYRLGQVFNPLEML